MGGTVSTGSSSTTSNSPAVRSLTDTLAKGVQSLYTPGATSYVAPGSTTTGAWDAALGTANNPSFSGGIAGAIDSYGNRAAGNELGIDDPLYAAQRARLTDDVMTGVNSTFTQSGRFGSGSHVDKAASSLASALGGLDLSQRSESYGRQAEAANMLPQMFSAGQLPSSLAASIGAAQDADKAAMAGGQIDRMGQLMGLLGGASSAAGTTTTEQMPWWKVLLGTAATAAGSMS